MARKPAPPSELQLLQNELRQVQSDLALAYDRFDQASEPELVESCIYEIKAIHARFSFLYRVIRERGGEAVAAAKPEEEKAWV